MWQWLEAWKHGETMDEAVATMLLGVIMIDAAGLDPKVRRHTQHANNLIYTDTWPVCAQLSFFAS